MFWNNKTQEERLMDKQLAINTSDNRERNVVAMVDPSDQTYLYQKEQTQDLTRWQQDLDDDVERLRHDFQNEVLTDKGYVKAYEGATALMTQEGTSKLIGFIKRYLTRNLIMSNLDEFIITRIMRGLVIDITIHLAMNWQQYKLDETDRSLVVRMIKDSIEPTLYRSYRNGERNYLNTINKRIETNNFSEKDQGRVKALWGGN